jgi:HK97 family phage major capsid protein
MNLRFEQRGDFLNQAEQMLDMLDREDRPMSPAEERKYNSWMDKIKLLQEVGPDNKRISSPMDSSSWDGGMPASMSTPINQEDVRQRISSPSGARLQAFANTRDGREAAYKSGKWLQATLLQDGNAAAWCQSNGMVPDIMAAHSGSTNTKGGALVPETMSSEIIRLVEEYGLFRRVSRGWPMTSDTENIPRRTGGLTASYVGENQEGDESDTAWDTVQLAAKKLLVLSRMSSELNEDSIINMADMLAMESALAFALKEDTVAFTGTGVSGDGGQVGVNVMCLDGSHNMAKVAAASGVDTLPEITADDLISLMAVLPKYAKRGAVWVCSPTAEEVVFNAIKVAGGGNTRNDLDETNRPRFLGYPVETTDIYPDSLTDTYNGAVMVGFGNLGLASTLGTRRDLRFMLSDHRYWELDQIGVKATMRHAINVHDLGSNTIKSPYAVLTGTT